MKSKILTILLILLSILCLFSCGGDDNDDSKKDYKIVTFIYGENNSKSEQICFYEDGSQSRELNYSTAIFGYNLMGFFTEDGTQYFGSDAKKLNDIIIDRELTVYAKYEPKNYKFIFDAQSGMLDDGLSKKEVLVDYGTDLNTVFLAPTNANPKFEFDGWFNEDGSVRYSYGTELVSDGPRWGNGFGADLEITLYAKFKVKELTVTLDFNDGVTPTQEIKVEYGQPVGDLSAYYKDNGTQDIASWSSISYGEIDLPTAITEDIRIYAVWKEYKNVLFVYGVGDERTIKVHQTPGESSTLPLQDNPGFNFEGWYTTSIFSGNPVENIPYGAVADKYYGKWSVADYTLSFDAGTGEVIDSVIYHYKDTTLLPSPEREGYTFGGWYYDKAENSFFKIPSTLYGDKQLLAYWAPNTYNVAYDAQGGEINKSKDKITFGESYTLAVPTRFGYTFLGWYSNDDIAYTNKDGVSLEGWKEASDKTLYAKWETNVYTITYEVNGGSQIAKQSYKHGEAITFPQPPTKNGVFFDGWFNEDLTSEYTEMQIALSDMTLYAGYVESIAISDADGLNAIRDSISAKYHLTNDINLRGESWAPIPEFTGSLDGQGYKIYNFNISANVATSKNVGLVGKNSGIIKNLVISDAVINCTSTAIDTTDITVCVGAIAGENHNKIINCQVVNTSIQGTGTIQSNGRKSSTKITNCFGSIAGGNSGNGLIESCKSCATISVSLEEYYTNNERPTGHGGIYTGGISGTNSSSNGTVIVRNCVFTGSITTNLSFTGTANGGYLYGYNHAGGIVPVNNGLIENCYTDATLNAKSTDFCGHNTWNWDSDSYSDVFVGGIASQNRKEIKNCISKGNYIGACNAGKQTGAYTKLIRMGGITGQSKDNANIENCYSNASVTMQAGSDRATGGLVGYNQGKIKNSYCTGNVTSTTGTAGGFVGLNETTGTIMNCFSLGNVAFTTAEGTKGIFVGNNRGSLKGCAFASESQLSAGGSAIAIPIVSDLTSMPKSDILNFGYIFNTLYWENTSWTAMADEYPRLNFEAALRLTENNN